MTEHAGVVEREEVPEPKAVSDDATSPPKIVGGSPFRPIYDTPSTKGSLIGFYWYLVQRATKKPTRVVLTVLAAIATALTLAVVVPYRFVRRYWIACSIAVGIALLVWLIIWLVKPRKVETTVASSTWEYRVDLRQKTLRHDEDWDDQMHSDAFNVSCSTRQRGTHQCNRHACGSHSERYACGNHSCNCHTSCSKNGNGFSTCRNVCSTCTDYCSRQVTDYCYDQCPTYDQWCSYDWYDWPIIKTQSTTGTCTPVAEGGGADEPKWPPLTADGPNQRTDHREFYNVKFQGIHENQSWSIKPDDLTTCRRYGVGDHWELKVNRVGQVWPQRRLGGP